MLGGGWKSRLGKIAERVWQGGSVVGATPQEVEEGVDGPSRNEVDKWQIQLAAQDLQAGKH